jgi:hypothetical protein
VVHDLDDDDFIEAIRQYEVTYRFPESWSDSEILDRVRDAERRAVRGSKITIRNYSVCPGDGKEVSIPLSMWEIIAEIRRRTDDWPRRSNRVLFIHDLTLGIQEFDETPVNQLFGWLQQEFSVKWRSGPGFVSKQELVAELKRTATCYDSIELIPHEPRLENTYYAVGDVQPGDGSALNWLVNRFRPATMLDRWLIQAGLMTPFWGGPPGRRPAFVVTGEEGRGVGKSVLVQLMARVVGGHLEVSANEDIKTVKQRFLSREGTTKRVAILDNVKTMKLSWAELEALVTAPTISGRQLYVGEGQRPNHLTWLITLNGVNLGADMAQRSVIINLIRGSNHGQWFQETATFIDKNRSKIIGDIVAALRLPQNSLSNYSRWADWERGVLSRLPEPDALQQLILERQNAADCDSDQARIVEEYFADRLRRLGYVPEKDEVRIPTRIAAEWFRLACNETTNVQTVGRILKQMANEKQLRYLKPDPSHSRGRGFIWTSAIAALAAKPHHDLEERIKDRKDAAKDS